MCSFQAGLFCTELAICLLWELKSTYWNRHFCFTKLEKLDNFLKDTVDELNMVTAQISAFKFSFFHCYRQSNSKACYLTVI
jgi:hypothetical protein